MGFSRSHWRSSFYGMLAVFAAGLYMASSGLAAHAQTFRVIHYFTGAGDGAYPSFPISINQYGALFGTTSDGGIRNCDGGGCGVVFKVAFRSSGWIFDTLYEFSNGSDGSLPNGPVAFDRSGAVYGAGWGNFEIYELRPSPNRSASVIAPWNINVLYGLGEAPNGDLVVDTAEQVFGTTDGGAFDEGTVFQLTPAGNGWSENTLYAFQGGADGADPAFGVIEDGSGNLYGVTRSGGTANCGTVFELVNTGSNWTKTILHNFQGMIEGCQPSGALSRDTAGNLYGNTLYSGYGQDAGTVYRLSPAGASWTFAILRTFNPGGPVGSIALDADGNVYGTTNGGGAYNFGSLFQLSQAGDGWTYTSLHDFMCPQDGCSPTGVAIDSTGNFFGLMNSGGRIAQYCDSGCGTLWELAQPR